MHEYHVRKNELKLVGNGVRDFEETTFREEATFWLEHRGKTFSPGHLKRVKGIISELKGDLVFVNDKGDPIWHESFAKSFFEGDAREAKVTRIRFHDMRHTATTLMIAAGIDVKTVKADFPHVKNPLSRELPGERGTRVSATAVARWANWGGRCAGVRLRGVGHA